MRSSVGPISSRSCGSWPTGAPGGPDRDHHPERVRGGRAGRRGRDAAARYGGVEVKFQDAPRLTPSMRIAREDLGLRRLTVLYPGDRRYSLERRVDVVPLTDLAVHGADAVIAESRQGRRGT